MAVSRTYIDAPPDAVFDVLTDAASYKIWVVGSKRIRGVDPDWPTVGSSFHHVVGWGPFQNRDCTTILELVRPHRLVLEAQAWPFGTANVTLEVAPSGRGTQLSLTEESLRGPAAKLQGPPVEAAIKARNAVALRRLRAWAEQRYHAIPGIRPEE